MITKPQYDTLTSEEQKQALQKVAEEKGFRNYNEYKESIARGMKFSSWHSYRNYLIRTGQIDIHKDDVRKTLREVLARRERGKKRQKRPSTRRIIRLSPRGVRTKKSWLLERLEEIHILRLLNFMKGRSFTLEEIQDIIESEGFYRCSTIYH
jgi:hypothetical protein